MDTHDALLAAVLAKPEDDLTRLVYADWCDENGQPERGEFVRHAVAHPARMVLTPFAVDFVAG